MDEIERLRSDLKEANENLTAVQTRCTELIQELRAYRLAENLLLQTDISTWADWIRFFEAARERMNTKRIDIEAQ